MIVARDLYALTRDDMDSVLSTFPAVKRTETRIYGEFKSQQLIHEAWASQPSTMPPDVGSRE